MTNSRTSATAELYRRFAPRVHAYVSCRSAGTTHGTEAAVCRAMRQGIRRLSRSSTPDPDAVMFSAAYAQARSGDADRPRDRSADEAVLEPVAVGGDDLYIDRLGPRILDEGDAERVVAATTALTGVQRDVLMLRFAGALPTPVAAEVLSLTPDDLRAVQATAIRALTARFGGDGVRSSVVSPRSVDTFADEVLAGRGIEDGPMPPRIAATVRLLADATRVRFPPELDARIRARVLGGGRPAAEKRGSGVAVRRMVFAAMVVTIVAAAAFLLVAVRRSGGPADAPPESTTGPSSVTDAGPAGAAATSTTATTTTSTSSAPSTGAAPTTAPQPSPATGEQPSPTDAPAATKSPSVTRDTRPFRITGD